MASRRNLDSTRLGESDLDGHLKTASIYASIVRLLPSPLHSIRSGGMEAAGERMLIEREQLRRPRARLAKAMPAAYTGDMHIIFPLARSP
jgi:hypothetical protein